AAQPEVRQMLSGTNRSAEFLKHFCEAWEAESAVVYSIDGRTPVALWGPYRAAAEEKRARRERAPVLENGRATGWVELTAPLPLDVNDRLAAINNYRTQWIQLRDNLK